MNSFGYPFLLFQRRVWEYMPTLFGRHIPFLFFSPVGNCLEMVGIVDLREGAKVRPRELLSFFIPPVDRPV